MGAVIVAGARTPMGRLEGALSSLSAAQLGARAIRAALERSGVAGDRVDLAIMGQVLTAGAGQLPARQAALGGGIGWPTPALTVSKVCLSGIQSVILADQFVRSGDAKVVVAGGQESMSSAPHLMRARRATKFGAITMADHMEVDGLSDPFTGESMGLLAERKNDEIGISRRRQDEYAALSHQRAAAAQREGRFDEEITTVTVPQRKGPDLVVDRDEGVRPETTADILAGLSPSFRTDGTITAGNSSPISDGAAALVVMDRDLAESEGIAWIAEIVSHGMVAGPKDSTMQLQPANAIMAACAKADVQPTALDLVEINEAFAAVVLSSADHLGLSEEIINVDGGAIAIGHPIGMSGARLVLHLALELRRRGGGLGAAALCGGTGQGDALLIRVPRD